MEWQKIEPSREIDLIINTTLVGMKENEQINIDTKNLEKTPFLVILFIVQKNQDNKF